MKTLIILTLLFLVQTVVSSNDQSKLIDEKYRIFMIVPQIIPKTPDDALSDIYDDYEANFGNRIPTCATRNYPFTSWPDANEKYLYTLIAIAPDIPQFYTSESGIQSLYGLVVNIPGGDIDRGDRLAPYVPPYCVPGYGDLRYVCLVYRQSARIPVTTELKYRISSRYGIFSISEFVARYKLGNPVAGNFFRVRCFVPCGAEDCNDCKLCDSSYSCGDRCHYHGNCDKCEANKS